jgi:hypothetical protein
MARLFFLGARLFGGGRVTIRGVDSESACLGRRPLQRNKERAANVKPLLHDKGQTA